MLLSITKNKNVLPTLDIGNGSGNNELTSEFLKCHSGRQTPEERQCVPPPKCLDSSNKNEDNSPRVNSVDNDNASSQIMFRVILLIIRHEELVMTS